MTASLIWPAVVCLAGATFFADSAIDDARHGFFPATRLLRQKVRVNLEPLPPRHPQLQLQQILEQEHITKTELASRMKTSPASLDRMLDPSNPSLTVASLGKAAAALGREVELRFVPA